jgi:DNA polymerase III alpha subunit
VVDTYGLSYEEHILLVANGFAGMPWGARTSCGALVKNKDRRKIAEMGAEFRACALGSGRTPEETEAVWALLEDFAGYMFNKAHSAAYAVEAFQGAYLKTRYPLEFLAAVLSSRRGFYAPIFYVLEALRCGARFLPPDVNLSEPRFLVRRHHPAPLDQVKGMSRDAGAHSRLAAVPGRGVLRQAVPARQCGAPEGGRARLARRTARALFWQLCRLEQNPGTAGWFDERDLQPRRVSGFLC